MGLTKGSPSWSAPPAQAFLRGCQLARSCQTVLPPCHAQGGHLRTRLPKAVLLRP